MAVSFERSHAHYVRRKQFRDKRPRTCRQPCYNVNSNGLLSFLTEIPSFFNIQFPLDYPVIAPLYTNVDTRGSGTVYYRETQDPSLLERASDAVRESFSSAADFTATSLFIATWDNVGYYNRGSDKVNTFQVVICSDGEDSYVQFLYADGGIQWIQSTGQSTGLPDARAQAGLMSGDGRLFTLRGSGTDQIQNLDKWSNIQVPGMWLFHVGLTGQGGNVMPPDLDGTSEAGKTDSCTLGKTLCHSKSHCVDHVTGFCCHCHSGYYGNGFNCLKEGIPLRVNGKVSGIVNGQEFSQLDLQSYVVTSDGRTYTAISRVQNTIGYDMQTLNVLGGVIGGVFNHTADISFPLTGNDVVIRQRYLGLDVFDQLKMEAEIQGSLPTIPLGTKIQIPDYEEQYTRTEPGVMVAKSSLIYRLDGVPVDNPFTVEQTVRFSECPHVPLNVTTVRLKVARNFISYEGRESIIRYAMTDKVTLSSGREHDRQDFDPCKEGRSKCGEHSFCRVEGNSFSCACNQGFQHLYSESDGVGSEICVDINECQTGVHDCDVNALCINEEGSYACQCVSGFVGNGQSCQKSCDQANDCSVYGACTLDATSDKYVCVCLPGYLGDGYYCVDSELHSNYTGSGVPVPTCVLGICWCPEGYDLQGQNSCAKKSDYEVPVTDTDTEDSLILSRPEPACYNSTLCFCPTGYTYEPLTGTCDLPPGANSHSHGTMGPTGHKPSCNIVNTCHPHAQCVLITQDNRYRCQCDAGYEGDGYECGEIDVSCEEVDICDIHATCTYDELREKAVCLCNPGYQGDGILCSVAGTVPVVPGVWLLRQILTRHFQLVSQLSPAYIKLSQTQDINNKYKPASVAA
uniref:Nidogen n=1 Tax=Timema bartmani TaxID=61472 RepID=A0A7R9F0B3_9NEOP|nr:unnamed protein product [Timema bartmani]